jgi:PAS domain S-box-containing protein
VDTTTSGLSATIKERFKTEPFQILVENVEDYAIFLLDLTGQVITWNKGAEKTKGYSADEIIGQHFSAFYLEEDRISGKPQKELRLAEAFGRIEDESWRIRRDGTKFWANVVITALFDEDRNLLGFAKVTRDLTERKRHEDELRKANELLLAQQKKLEVLNESKDEFLSLASHQLRTPATSVKQFLGMLIDGFVGELDDKQAEFVRRAYDSNERQIGIINDLLRVAQIDAGDLSLSKEVLAVNEIITEAVHNIHTQIDQRSQIIDIEEHATTFIKVDREKFRMAIENLIDNASKYTRPEGKIFIAARTNKDFCEISIKDTGVGIAVDDMGRLFTKFNRIPNDLSNETNGSGLGLYWVEKVVKLHGGTIHVESEIDQGSTFTVSVPVA